jgi:hypothetical protein
LKAKSVKREHVFIDLQISNSNGLIFYVKCHPLRLLNLCVKCNTIEASRDCPIDFSLLGNLFIEIMIEIFLEVFISLWKFRMSFKLKIKVLYMRAIEFHSRKGWTNCWLGRDFSLTIQVFSNSSLISWILQNR